MKNENSTNWIVATVWYSGSRFCSCADCCAAAAAAAAAVRVCLCLSFALCCQASPVIA